MNEVYSNRASLIGVDWGSTNRRGFLLDSNGSILDSKEDGLGLLNISDGKFLEAFEALTAVWMEKCGPLPSLLSGMVGASTGWTEAKYCTLPAGVEEALYPAMEDFQIDLVIGQGPATRTMKLNLPPFTLVGATTKAGALTSPLRERFGLVYRLDFYTPEELDIIVNRSAGLLNIPIEPEGSTEIGKRARGTPRIANRLVKRVRDFAEVKAEGMITQKVARDALQWLGVDSEGFDEMDRKILLTILDKFNGGPVGIETLAAAVQEEKATLEDVYEPFLLQAGYLDRTARGRQVTAKTFQHFGRTKGLFG